MENLRDEQIALIIRHLKGETSFAEEDYLKRWLNENKENEKLFKEIKLLWTPGTQAAHDLPDVEKAWKKVKVKSGIESDDSGIHIRRFDTGIFWKVAASIVFIIGIGYIANLVFLTKESATEYVSSNEKKEIFLPDSSKVSLNKNSKLTVPENYNEQNRELYLEGEAFFEVRKSKEKPFIVNGELSKTTVLGTSFSVKTVKGSSSDEVEVVTGKVAFAYNKKPDSPIILTPGEKATIDKVGRNVKAKPDLNSLSWYSDKMTFQNTPLNEVLSSMEKHFNIDIEISNPQIQNCSFTGTFVKPQVEEMMQVLSLSINLSYNKKDKTYFLSGKGCN